ncbi:MAG: bifunctional 2-C-methyl-D-erythritol 4-phosphate cytidylyltransferase/2-C-methyl-D-erythritol 2,4-cyclodiphosphate synthase [Pseudomonadota bacterium]
MQVGVVIVAAGRGTRAGGSKPKQYQRLAGRVVLERTVAAFHSHPAIAEVCVVIHPDDRDLAQSADLGAVTLVAGGATRRASVGAGLDALERASHVLIHDGARPLVSADLISRVVTALQSGPAAAPALTVTDALWKTENNHVLGMQSREGLARAQTPQGFDLARIRTAHAAHHGDAADDVEVALKAGLDVAVVTGDETNLKITDPEDFARAEALLQTIPENSPQNSSTDIRTGNGFDVHRFGPGDHVILCGVKIPHGRGLQGHSDADVGMHAVTDAIYGALAEGDIGQHFPPSDPQWKGAASEIFLRHASELAQSRGYRITHADCTLICERPKIGPHAQAMRAAMAAILGIDVGAMSVKATTSERLGFTGREEGIAALASATLVRP